MKRIVGGAVALGLLLVGCGGEDSASPGEQGGGRPDSGTCTTLADAWAEYVTGDAVMSLNGQDLTATKWEEIYSDGKALLSKQKAAVAKLTDSTVKSAWGDWESAGGSVLSGLEQGDSMAVARKGVATWAESGKVAVAACDLPTDGLPALSSSAPSVGG